MNPKRGATAAVASSHSGGPVAEHGPLEAKDEEAEPGTGFESTVLQASEHLAASNSLHRVLRSIIGAELTGKVCCQCSHISVHWYPERDRERERERDRDTEKERQTCTKAERQRDICIYVERNRKTD